MVVFRHIHRGVVVQPDSDPKMRFTQRDRSFVITLWDPETRKNSFIKVPQGEPMLLDFGCIRHGHECFSKGMRYDLRLYPIGESLPEPEEHYLPVGWMQAIVQDRGRVQLIVDNDVIAEIISEFYDNVLISAAEAAAGLIPIVKLDHELRMVLVKWIARDPKYLGPRTTEPPATVMENQAA